MPHFTTKTLLSLSVGAAAVLLFAATSRVMWDVSDSVRTHLEPTIESQEVFFVVTVQGMENIEDRSLINNFLNVYALDDASNDDPDADDMSSDKADLRTFSTMIRLELDDGTELVPFTDQTAQIDGLFDDCEDTCVFNITAEVITDVPIELVADLSIYGNDSSIAPEGVDVQVEIDDAP
ncbi:MAG: hypothetical protein ACI9MC_003204 [Kiritimatiellia bacterium]|jgi:hypothetical protein